MRHPSAVIGLLIALTSAAPLLPAAQPVLQRGYDAGLSGANLGEKVLNTTTVTGANFGLLFPLSVDDNVFAQPLYVPAVSIPGQGVHNVVYVATMGDTLYAFDADTGGAPLWSVDFTSRIASLSPPGTTVTPVPIGQFVFSGNRNITGNLGILSTPVIDPATRTLYLVTGTLENGTIVYRLHAVNIASGTELAKGNPVAIGTVIAASYTGVDTTTGNTYPVTFDARYQTQRVSLALAGNNVVFGFGALELEFAGGYVGWVMAYDKQTLQQTGRFATVTSGNLGGGVWQSGRAPAVDASGYVYVFTGNAYGNGYDGQTNFSESVLKLDAANGLALADWFTPSNWSSLDSWDADLTSSGPLLIPGTSLLAGGGKTGTMFVLDTLALGGNTPTDSGAVQEIAAASNEIRGGPVYWNRPAAGGGPLLYDWGAYDVAKAFAFNGATFATSPAMQGGSTLTWPGGELALSANGAEPGSGILWANVSTGGDAENNPPTPGALVALNAENLSQQLWSSTTNSARDGLGSYGKFVPPLVANGKVYVATWSQQVAVYGTLGALPATETVTVAPAGNGKGMVRSATPGIACGATCSAPFNTGSNVTLTATPAATSAFAGWSGGCTTTSGNTCTVALIAAASTVGATFNLVHYPLTVTPPTTPGSVYSGTDGIKLNCGTRPTQTACSGSYVAATAVHLTATPHTGHSFVGWGGACSGTAPACIVPMSQARSVSATFQ